MGLSVRIPRLRENSRFAFYGIADGGTFSSGVQNTEFLKIDDDWAKQLARQSGLAAILVGEGTGGKPVHFGEVAAFSLGASQLRVQHSTRAFPNQPWIPDRDSVYPDVMLRLRSSDHFTRHDAWMALAQVRSRRLPAAPEGEATVVNAASFRPEHGIAPGAWASSFGAFPAGPAELRIEGRPAQVIASTPNQLVFRVPPETAPGARRARLRSRTAPGRPLRGEPSRARPIHGERRGPHAARRHPQSGRQPQRRGLSRAARQRSADLCHRPGTRRPPPVWISGELSEVQYSGRTASGRWQINAVVPAAAAVGTVPVYVAAGGLASNAVTVQVE